ncbi:Hypothetical protein MVR_LOCUS273 [uncultured virus]|nr:Hypothetical protein MVR_LOCUS273 [uncultured virus]
MSLNYDTESYEDYLDDIKDEDLVEDKTTTESVNTASTEEDDDTHTDTCEPTEPDLEQDDEQDEELTPPPKPKALPIADRSKRPLPQKLLENQKKHEEALERQRQQRDAKKGKAGSNSRTPEPKAQAIAAVRAAPPGTRRVVVAGKVRYLPIKTAVEPEPESTFEIPIVHNHSPSKVVQEIKVRADPEPTDTTEPTEPEPRARPLPANIAKAQKQHEALQATLQEHPAMRKQMGNKKGSRAPAGTRNKIPGKYAKQIEQEARKQTQRNIRNFADLRRMHEIQSIDANGDIDVNKASIQEIRRIRVEQRQKEQAEQKRRAASNKRESAVQEILGNEGMSKFAKMVAIKNLSASSRVQKAQPKRAPTPAPAPSN